MEAFLLQDWLHVSGDAARPLSVQSDALALDLNGYGAVTFCCDLQGTSKATLHYETASERAGPYRPLLCFPLVAGPTDARILRSDALSRWVRWRLTGWSESETWFAVFRLYIVCDT